MTGGLRRRRGRRSVTRAGTAARRAGCADQPAAVFACAGALDGEAVFSDAAVFGAAAVLACVADAFGAATVFAAQRPSPAASSRLDRRVGRHAEQLQRAARDRREHRAGHRAAVVALAARLVDHHRDDQARVAHRRHPGEQRAVLALRIGRADLLARGTRLAADPVAVDARGAPCRLRRPPSRASSGSPRLFAATSRGGRDARRSSAGRCRSSAATPGAACRRRRRPCRSARSAAATSTGRSRTPSSPARSAASACSRAAGPTRRPGT